MTLLLKYQHLVYLIGFTWIAAFYTVLLLVALVEPGRIARFLLCNRFLVKLGTVAYSVYIFHLGINSLFHFAILGQEPSISGWPSLSVTLLSLVTVMLLAALSWRLIEKPLIRGAHALYRY